MSRCIGISPVGAFLYDRYTDALGRGHTNSLREMLLQMAANHFGYTSTDDAIEVARMQFRKQQRCSKSKVPMLDNATPSKTEPRKSKSKAASRKAKVKATTRKAARKAPPRVPKNATPKRSSR